MRHLLFRWTSLKRQKRSANVLALLFLTIGLMSSPVRANDLSVAPDLRYSAQEVIAIVVDSLQTNTSNDEGIATVYRFASPQNKANTGPLPRFAQMIKRGFPDMLNHIGVRYDPIELTGDVAVQAVWLQTTSGAEYGYAFQVRKQQYGENAGMWMTEAVVPLGQSERSGVGI